MRDIFAVIGALSVGATFMLILLGILHERAHRADRKARARQQHSAEQLEHVRRFSAVQAVLDFDAYRARKANAPATGVQAPSLGASRSVAEAANPRAESLTTSAEVSNA